MLMTPGFVDNPCETINRAPASTVIKPVGWFTSDPLKSKSPPDASMAPVLVVALLTFPRPKIVPEFATAPPESTDDAEVSWITPPLVSPRLALSAPLPIKSNPAALLKLLRIVPVPAAVPLLTRVPFDPLMIPPNRLSTALFVRVAPGGEVDCGARP